MLAFRYLLAYLGDALLQLLDVCNGFDHRVPGVHVLCGPALLVPATAGFPQRVLQEVGERCIGDIFPGVFGVVEARDDTRLAAEVGTQHIEFLISNLEPDLDKLKDEL